MSDNDAPNMGKDFGGLKDGTEDIVVGKISPTKSTTYDTSKIDTDLAMVDPKFLDTVNNLTAVNDSKVVVGHKVIPEFGYREKSPPVRSINDKTLKLPVKYVSNSFVLKSVTYGAEEIIMISVGVDAETFVPQIMFAVKIKDPMFGFLKQYSFYYCDVSILHDGGYKTIEDFFAPKKKSFLTKLKELFTK